MDIELKKNRRSGKCFIVCAEQSEKVIVSCPDGEIRTLPESLFEESFFRESEPLIEEGAITAKQYAVFLYDKEVREKDPVIAALDFQVEEMTPHEIDNLIKELEKIAARGKK